nr:unnamed protein product [Callosobruchus chinensis]
MTLVELKESLERQNRILMNKKIIDDQQHVQHICEIEKRTSVTERYKPSSTLYHSKEINPHSTAIRLIEDCGTSQNPSKLIPLGESLCIQKQQEERVQEEQIRRRQKSLFEKLLQYLPDDADSSEENSLESSIASSMENLVMMETQCDPAELLCHLFVILCLSPPNVFVDRHMRKNTYQQS